MHFKRIAVIGTNYISTSIALGLKEQSAPPEIIGYDTEAVAADLARSMGAFDGIELKLDRVCRDAELVIVSAPLSILRDTFAVIAPHLKPNCLVTDTASLKCPVMRWAEELLPDKVFFIGGHVILNPAVIGLDPVYGLDLSSADLLAESLYCITPPQETPQGLIDVFAEMIKSLNARPFFIDAVEHDGLQSGVNGLPDLLAIALLRATIDTPGWQEMRKFADHRFATATKAAEGAHERHVDLLLNQEQIVRRLNVLINELINLRDLLGRNDATELEREFTKSVRGRSRWLREREQGMWIRDRIMGAEPAPSLGQQIKRMFLGTGSSWSDEKKD